jgi:hypothetical protein
VDNSAEIASNSSRNPLIENFRLGVKFVPGRIDFVALSMCVLIVSAGFSGDSIRSKRKDPPAISSINFSGPATQAASPTPSPKPAPVSNGAIPVVSPNGSQIDFF